MIIIMSNKTTGSGQVHNKYHTKQERSTEINNELKSLSARVSHSFADWSGQEGA